MPPLYDLDCCRCHHRFEVLVKGKHELTDTNCPKCGCHELQLRFNAIANYTIKGDNSSSTRPKKSKSTE